MHHFQRLNIYREWILTKVVNGERASYSAPKFARMQERTRSQMLEDIVANLANHAETGQIPKPYRRGSWRPIGNLFYTICVSASQTVIIRRINLQFYFIFISPRSHETIVSIVRFGTRSIRRL